MLTSKEFSADSPLFNLPIEIPTHHLLNEFAFMGFLEQHILGPFKSRVKTTEHGSLLLDSPAWRITHHSLFEFAKNTYDALFVKEGQAPQVFFLELQIYRQESLEKPPQIIIQCRDFGSGFPKDFLNAKDFLDYSEKLKRKEDAITPTHISSEKNPQRGCLGGRGIGLARASKLARAFGGTVFIGNHPDGGALIQISTPVTCSAQKIREHCPREVINHDLIKNYLRKIEGFNPRFFSLDSGRSSPSPTIETKNESPCDKSESNTPSSNSAREPSPTSSLVLADNHPSGSVSPITFFAASSPPTPVQTGPAATSKPRRSTLPSLMLPESPQHSNPSSEIIAVQICSPTPVSP